MFPCALQVKLQHPHISPSCIQSNVSSRYRCNPARISSPAPLLWKKKTSQPFIYFICSCPLPKPQCSSVCTSFVKRNAASTSYKHPCNRCPPHALSSQVVVFIHYCSQNHREITSSKAIETLKYPMTTRICCRLLKLLGGVIGRVRPCIQPSLSYSHSKLVGTCLKTKNEYGLNRHLMARHVLSLLDARLFSG